MLEHQSPPKNIQKEDIYNTFPLPKPNIWGAGAMKSDNPEDHRNSIFARIRFISEDIRGLEKKYAVDSNLVKNLNDAFNDLAYLYIEMAKVAYPTDLYPMESKDGKNVTSFEPIRMLDKKLEEIMQIISFDAAKIFNKEAECKTYTREEKMALYDQSLHAMAQEKENLHIQGEKKLEEALLKITELQQKLAGHLPLN